jgi:hypothetical protein
MSNGDDDVDAEADADAPERVFYLATDAASDALGWWAALAQTANAHRLVRGLPPRTLGTGSSSAGEGTQQLDAALAGTRLEVPAKWVPKGSRRNLLAEAIAKDVNLGAINEAAETEEDDTNA